MVGQVLRSFVVYLVALSLTAPALAWANVGPPSIASIIVEDVPAEASLEKHEQSRGVQPENSRRHHGADIGYSDIDSCCGFGCHVAVPSSDDAQGSPLSQVAIPVFMTAFVLVRDPSDLYRPPPVLS